MQARWYVCRLYRFFWPGADVQAIIDFSGESFRAVVHIQKEGIITNFTDHIKQLSYMRLSWVKAVLNLDTITKKDYFAMD
ncbi:MAG: hypothetical protein ABIJ31_00995 [Pseudomonadota bacterium]